MIRHPIVILSTMICALLCFTHNADAKKRRKKKHTTFARAGKFTIGGDLSLKSLSKSNVEDKTELEDTTINTSTFMLSPRVGYFVFANKTFAAEVAAQIGFGSEGSEKDGKEGGSLSSWEVGLDVPLYLTMFRRQSLFPFLHFSYLRQSVTSKASKDADEIDLSGNQLRLGLGASFALGRKEGGFVKLSIDYVLQNSLVNEDGNGNNENGMDVGLGFGLFF